MPLQEGMVFDPFSGNLDGTGRSVFSSGGRLNVIPQGRFNGPMMTMLGLVPQPNQDGDFENYFVSGKQRLNRNNFDGKVNWNRNDRHQLFFKYSAMTALVHGDFGLGAAGGECICDGGVGDGNTLVQIAGIGQTYTVSPTLVIDGTFGWTRFGQDVHAARPRHQLRTGRARDPWNERAGPAGKRHAGDVHLRLLGSRQ